MNDEELLRLEREIEANYGSEVLARFKALQAEWESAVPLRDFARAREITAIQEALFAPDSGEGNRPSVASPAQQLTDFFEAMMRLNEGARLYNAGEFVAAIEQFNNVLRLVGLSQAEQEKNVAGDAWMNKGLCLGRLGRLGEAIGCYDKAIELKPNEPSFRKEREHAIEWQRTHEER